MNGESLPYHLRTNKAIEREIFFELLSQLNLPKPISEFQYISLGGPMLEDMRVLHNNFHFTKLTSLEKDSATHSRQSINNPFSCINCLKQSTRDFILNFEPEEEESHIFWLDYVDTKWKNQVEEVYELMNKLRANDLLKVTFNANPQTLEGETEEEKLQDFIQKNHDKYTSQNLVVNDVTSMSRMAQTLASIFKNAVEDALEGDDMKFTLLSMFRYIDNRHHMMTITGIVSQIDTEDTDVLDNLNLASWPHQCSHWADIKQIQVPDLTYHERHLINQKLPSNPDDFDPNQLPFRVSRNQKSNTEALKSYVKYYKYIPNYQKLAV